jgi:MFS family permease
VDGGKISAFSGLWRSPDFIKFLTGQTISILGSHITTGGLPLLALLTLQSTPFQMGVLQAIGSAPVLLFSLLVGGILGQKLGPQATLFIAVVGIALGGLWLVFSPVRKLQGFSKLSQSKNLPPT